MRRGNDRREARSNQDRRGSHALQKGDGRSRVANAARRIRHFMGRSRSDCYRDGLSRDHSSFVHIGRHRWRHSFQSGRVRRDRAPWLAASPIHEVLIEESILGWKEFELEVMRDLADNVVIICSIENFDPMGVHTGDSITVAPAQTLTDREYQRMRDASIAIIREIGVETGGSNVQFAINPANGRMVIIEMNPRVSRSSALASK